MLQTFCVIMAIRLAVVLTADLAPLAEHEVMAATPSGVYDERRKATAKIEGRAGSDPVHGIGNDVPGKRSAGFDAARQWRHGGPCTAARDRH